MDQSTKLTVVNTVFSPSAPIQKRDFFMGRLEQLSEVENAIAEPGQHIVLYGERGVGKTSLANIIRDGLQNVLSAKVTCNRNQNFMEAWKAALGKIRFDYTTQGIGFLATERKETYQLNLFLPNNLDSIDSHDIQNILERVDNYLLFIFDEFDSIKDEDTRIRFADTIKSLSDNAPNVTILIVGIAENVTGLIGEHPSLERCLRQIRMPRMSRQELKAIITNGLNLLEMTIDDTVTEKIVSFSLGFPHFTHLLSKYSTKAAVINKENHVTSTHLKIAIDDCIQNANQIIRSAYQTATITSKEKSKFEDVIGACAFASTDEYETFSTNDLIEPFLQITGSKTSRESLTYYLSRLCTTERGSLLEKVGKSKNIRYRFRNPLMRAYVMLRLSKRGMVAPENES